MHTEPIRTVLRQKERKLYWLSPNATVLDAITMMADKGIGALLILEDDRLVGFVSERDYARKVILKGRHSHDTLVREIMSTPVFTVDPDHSVAECMRSMTDLRIRHLPVVEGGKVVGVVSIGDLVKWMVLAQEDTIRHLQSYIASA